MTVPYLPNFNLTANVWHWPHTAAADPPDLTAVPCQLYHSKTLTGPYTYTDSFAYKLPSHIRFPAGTDVRCVPNRNAEMDQLEVPAGSGIIYEVHQVLDWHRGFPNEYRVALSLMLSTPLPMP